MLVTRCVPVVVATGLSCLSTGCPLVDARVEIGETCMSYHDLSVDGAPVGQTEVTTSFVFDDLGGLRDLADLADTEIHFVRFAARMTSGARDLSFLQAATVTVASGVDGATLPPLVVVDCDGDCAPDGAHLDVDAAGQPSAVEYLRQDSLLVDVHLVGDLPKKAFTLDVDVCVDGSVHYAVEP